MKRPCAACFIWGGQMLDQRGPFLEKGHWTRRPRWSLRITCPLVQQSKDEPADHLRLPASYLTNMARYGYNATYLYIDWFDYMSPEVAGPLARPGWEKRFDELRKATGLPGRLRNPDPVPYQHHGPEIQPPALSIEPEDARCPDLAERHALSLQQLS